MHTVNTEIDTFVECKRAELQRIKHAAVGSCPDVNFVLQYAIIAGPGTRAVKGVGLRPFACWDCGFDSCRGHAYLPVVCCQVEISAMG